MGFPERLTVAQMAPIVIIIIIVVVVVVVVVQKVSDQELARTEPQQASREPEMDLSPQGFASDTPKEPKLRRETPNKAHQGPLGSIRVCLGLIGCFLSLSSFWVLGFLYHSGAGGSAPYACHCLGSPSYLRGGPGSGAPRSSKSP